MFCVLRKEVLSSSEKIKSVSGHEVEMIENELVKVPRCLLCTLLSWQYLAPSPEGGSSLSELC